MPYEIDQFYEFPIVGGVNPEEKHFVLEVDGPEGKTEVTLPKLAFQQDPKRPTPQSLTCRVKSMNSEGLPVLGHALSSYVYELYNEAHARGEYLEAQVVGIPSNPAEELFTIRDSYGILYRLYDREGLLTKGQIVRCKFTKLAPHFFEIQRVDEGANMPFYSTDYLMDAVGLRGTLRRFVRQSLASLPEFASVKTELRAKNPLWLMTAARIIQRHLPEWCIRMKNELKSHNYIFTELLAAFRNACLYLIEGSGFLNAVPYENQRSLQQQFTEIIDSLEPYFTILELIREDGQVNFVERLLDKLQRSGYLYHPARQFAVLMLIFRMDPDKVGAYLNRIFESIFSRDLENWKREPFRSAFVEQFEIYVHQMRSEIDAMPLAETREQKQRLETIITAIALQLILADSDARLSRSQSLFYRYISLLRPESCEKLLSKSFLTLLGVKQGGQLDYKQLKQPMMMMTRATVMAEGDFMERIVGTHRFNGPTADIDISAEGITLSRPGLRDFALRVIPESAMPWLRPQVRLDGMRTLSKSRKLDEHKRWWRDVETALLAEKSGKIIRQHQLKTPEQGDEVYIIITGIVEYDSSNPTFGCVVHDKEFAECRGTIKREDIVGYNLNTIYPNTFVDQQGKPLEYNARVIGQNPDGTLRFSLLSEVSAYEEHVFNSSAEGEEFLAVVASSKNNYYGTQLGISRLGFGVSFKVEKDESYPNGTLVYFKVRERNMSFPSGQAREFYIVRTTDDESDNFDKLNAFYDLMQAIGYEQEDGDVEDASQNLMRDIDEMLTPDDVREIIEIIRFSAYAQSDLISAYDYLSFAAMMAAIIGDERLYERLKTHAELLILHQYYATNSRLDNEALERLRDVAATDPALSMIFRRLEIVSWLGDNSHNAELFAIVSEPSCELEGNVAQMVLASNLLADNDNSEKSVVSQIKQLLMSRLNVNSETKRGKYYGLESKFLEFKTSLVFPAVGRGEQMRTDPVGQQNHILSRIAGMLNADGGQLMLGVNDHGYEVGMHDDFEYYRRNTVFDGKGYQKITSLPDLCKFLELLVNNRFGKTVARKINVTVDTEAEKGVVLIDIEQSLEPVFLDGKLYVRQSGEVTQEYHGNEIDEFVAERRQLRLEREQQQELNARTKNFRAESETAATSVENEPAQAEVTVETTSETQAPAEEGRQIVRTSAWRPNVLHEYEEGYVEPAGYIYFYEGYMQFSSVDKYPEDNPGFRLALAIPHEMSDGYLLLGFQGEKAQRIPLAEIYDKGENVEIPYWQDDALMFAAIAGRDDIVVCVFADGGGSLWQRGVKMSQIESCHITSAPRRIHDSNLDHTFAWEIAVPEAESRLAECMADTLGSRRYGYTMRVKEGTPFVGSKMTELIGRCQPAL